MKKTAVEKLKKLRLSRETLHVLTNADTRMVVGGTAMDSCQSGCLGCRPFTWTCDPE
jgi:hypothetical protein